jgi:hypothetical protein
VSIEYHSGVDVDVIFVFWEILPIRITGQIDEEFSASFDGGSGRGILKVFGHGGSDAISTVCVGSEGEREADLYRLQMIGSLFFTVAVFAVD